MGGSRKEYEGRKKGGGERVRWKRVVGGRRLERRGEGEMEESGGRKKVGKEGRG